MSGVKMIKMSTEAVEWSSNESALGRVLAGMHHSWIRFIHTEMINTLVVLLIAFKSWDAEERIHSLLCGRRQGCRFLRSRCSLPFNRFNVWSMLFVQLGRWLRAVCRVWPRTSHGRHISRPATIFTATSLTANANGCAMLRCRVRRWWKDLGHSNLCRSLGGLKHSAAIWHSSEARGRLDVHLHKNPCPAHALCFHWEVLMWTQAMPNRWALEATFEAVGQEPGMKSWKKSTMQYHYAKLYLFHDMCDCWPDSPKYGTSDFLIDCGPGSASHFLLIADMWHVWYLTAFCSFLCWACLVCFGNVQLAIRMFGQRKMMSLKSLMSYQWDVLAFKHKVQKCPERVEKLIKTYQNISQNPETWVVCPDLPSHWHWHHGCREPAIWWSQLDGHQMESVSCGVARDIDRFGEDGEDDEDDEDECIV